MAEGKIQYGDRLRWNHTAGIMGLIHNANAEKKNQVTFDHYNPYVKSKPKVNSTKLDKTTITALKALVKKA